MLAQSMAFNGMTIKQYVDKIFLWAVDDNRKLKEKFPATTAIRLDVAHFVAAAARWNCLNDKHKFRTKRFYVRVNQLRNSNTCRYNTKRLLKKLEMN